MSSIIIISILYYLKIYTFSLQGQTTKNGIIWGENLPASRLLVVFLVELCSELLLPMWQGWIQLRILKFSITGTSFGLIRVTEFWSLVITRPNFLDITELFDSILHNL